MEGQQYMLRCKDFYERIGASIQNLFVEDQFVDVTIACDGALFKAHKMILSACSPYFRKILQQNPCQHPVILLQNVLEKDMKDILSYVYYGEVNIEIDSLEAFLKTAKFLQVQGLADVKNVAGRNNNFSTLAQDQYNIRREETRYEIRQERIEPITETTSSRYLNELRNETEKPQEPPKTFTLKEEPYYSDMDDETSTSSKSNLQSEQQKEQTSPQKIQMPQENHVKSPQNQSKKPQNNTKSPQNNNKVPQNSGAVPISNSDTGNQAQSSGLPQVPCPICGRYQKNEYYLKFHLAKAHQQKAYMRFMPTDVSGGEFHCPFCSEKFHTKRDLNAHILTIHQKENYNDMKCSICAKQFSSVSNRNQHVLRYHAKVLD